MQGNMLRVAVYHHDTDQRKLVAKVLQDGLRSCNASFRLYSINSFKKFAENLQQGKYQFDIICMETSDRVLASAVMQRNEQDTEFILLDTLAEEVPMLLRYKPVGWLKTDGINENKAVDALQACLHHLYKKEGGAFCIRTKTKSLKIPYKQILYFESHQHQVIVHTLQQKNACAFTATLDAVETSLIGERFVRCHQSYLVNPRHVYQIDRTNRKLVFYDGNTVDISKRYYKEIGRVFEDTKIQLAAARTLYGFG